MSKNQYGGDAIASGGFGCVFRPALKCRTGSVPHDATLNADTEYVSKLLYTQDAKDEMAESNSFGKTLQLIKDYEKYFIFPIKRCKPKPLTKDDHREFDSVCSKLVSNGYSSLNINKYLDDFRILMIPNGGIDLNMFCEKNSKISYDLFKNINTSLIDLLENGIVKMNKLHLYHLDLKAHNVMLDIDNTRDNVYTKIIDWGLSQKIKSSKNVYNQLKGRPLQFNLPPSIILLSNSFLDFIHDLYDDYDTVTLTRDIVIDHVMKHLSNKYFKSFGNGHRDYINYMSRIIFDKTTHQNYHIKDYFIASYISDIILEYRKPSNSFDKSRFSKTLLSNCDIWGFLITYLPFMKVDNMDNQDSIKHDIRELFINYMVKYSSKTIPINDVIMHLHGINQKLKLSNKTSHILVSKTPKRFSNIVSTETIIKKHSAKTKKNKMLSDTVSESPGLMKKIALLVNNVKKTKRRRCPNGTRYNRLTRKCETK